MNTRTQYADTTDTQTWHDADKELPPVNTIVIVELTNQCISADFVNRPIDNTAPFQHYLVSKWRFPTRQELNDMLDKIYHA